MGGWIELEPMTFRGIEGPDKAFTQDAGLPATHFGGVPKFSDAVLGAASRRAFWLQRLRRFLGFG